MKRRRGSKKGKAKKPKLSSTVANDVVSNVASLHTEENSALDDSDNMVDSGTDAETKPSPPECGQPEALNNTDSVGRPVNNTSVKAVYTRVKVKIKTSKNLESHHAASDALALGDTEKSSQHFGSEKHLVPNDRMEDSSNSLSETKEGVSGTTSKKSMGIKIKSSTGFGCSSMSPCSNTETVKGDRTEKKDVELLHQDSKNSEQELKAALEVIRKVMKMDAAEPFNVPVNPVTLGIPDYFDVIDTPMDFGTICSNLEKGVKYKSSEDVFSDVQYIWDNCYKYNNKGDYIVELMKRVRKNFTRYWTAVGLFNDDEPQETDGRGRECAVSCLEDMGRAKLNMELISKEKSRNITFKKRKEGLIRKIREFTTLCAVEACMIIYGPKQEKVSTDPEFWPENMDEMRRIIDIHKAKNKDSGNKYGLSNFFHDRRKKIEDELSKLRKKNMEARFPTWIDFMNCLTEAQLREFAANLTAKYEHIRPTVHLKRSKEVFDVNLTDFGELNPSQNQSFYNPGLIQRGNIEFEVINQPAISSMKPMHCPDLDHHQELHSVNQQNSMMMLMLSDNDHCLQFGGASTSGNISFKHQVFYESTPMDPMIGHSPRTSLPRFYAPSVAPSFMMSGVLPMQIPAAAPPLPQLPFFTRESLDEVDLMQYQMRGTGAT